LSLSPFAADEEGQSSVLDFDQEPSPPSSNLTPIVNPTPDSTNDFFPSVADDEDQSSAVSNLVDEPSPTKHPAAVSNHNALNSLISLHHPSQ
jgi:hypothetical protein